MRHLLIRIFLFASVFCYAQKTTEIKLKKEEFKKCYAINDLIVSIPKTCKVKSYVYSLVIKGVEKSQKISGDVIELWLRKDTILMKGVFFIEKIESECMGSHRQKYKIVVE